MKSKCFTRDLLVRTLDKELSAEEERWTTGHLAECAECRHELAELAAFSVQLQSAINSAEIPQRAFEREQLAARLKSAVKATPAPAAVMRRFGWGMAIAATLALGILIAPKQAAVHEPGPVAHSSATPGSLEVDGETFIALPYSNPDLPASVPRVVQMQVPVSSLADIGIAMEPLANQVWHQDRSVLADVLLGADGQPLGVHVVSWD
jgi:anti-sigma factor RsiW